MLTHADADKRFNEARFAVAVMRNALDFSTHAERLRAGLAREISSLARLGITTEELDLRRYFGPHELRRALRDFAGLWVVGGELLTATCDGALRLDAILQDRIEDRQFVYAGYLARRLRPRSVLRRPHS